MTVLVDTNVLLDVLLEREPHCAASARIWALAEGGRIRAWISAISHNNIFHIIERLNGSDRARESLRVIRRLFRTVTLDERMLDAALATGVEDFEDAIQYHAALKAGASHLITRNPDDFPADAGLEIVTPAEFLALMGAGKK